MNTFLKTLLKYMAPGFFLYFMSRNTSSLFYFLEDDKVIEVKHDEETDEVSYVFKKSGKIEKVVPRKIENVEELFPTVWSKFRKILNQVSVAKVFESKLESDYVIVVYENGIVVKMKPEGSI